MHTRLKVDGCLRVPPAGTAGTCAKHCSAYDHFFVLWANKEKFAVPAVPPAWHQDFYLCHLLCHMLCHRGFVRTLNFPVSGSLMTSPPGRSRTTPRSVLV